MEYLLALDCKGDDQLPRRASIFFARRRLATGQVAAATELNKVYDHARNDL